MNINVIIINIMKQEKKNRNKNAEKNINSINYIICFNTLNTQNNWKQVIRI